jgi:hypothetical protein
LHDQDLVVTYTFQWLERYEAVFHLDCKTAAEGDIFLLASFASDASRSPSSQGYGLQICSLRHQAATRLSGLLKQALRFAVYLTASCLDSGHWQSPRKLKPSILSGAFE